jgi:Rieske Fe-S protein
MEEQDLWETEPWKVPLRLQPLKKPNAQQWSRRRVVALLTTGGVAATLAAVAGITLHRQPTQQPGTGSSAPTQPLPANAIGQASLAVNSSKTFLNPNDGNESLLIHLATGAFVVYERACTHVGVNVNYDPTTHTLICPAHGAVFDPAKQGAVLQGPATQPLPSVAIQVQSNGAIVAL